MNVLIIEGGHEIAKAVQHFLSIHFIESDIRYEAEDGFQESLSFRYDVIIIESKIKGVDNLGLVKKIRSKNVDTPILVLSNDNSIDYKVSYLIFGADDFLVVPFIFEEFLARLYVLARRNGQIRIDKLSFGDLYLDRLNHRFLCKDKVIALSNKEFMISELLIKNQGNLVSKDLMVDKVWGFDSDSTYNSVEVYVSFLRNKIKKIGSKVYIQSRRNNGYFLESLPVSNKKGRKL